jgi:RNA polymerase sigma-70 factor (ECF subfamily)
MIRERYVRSARGRVVPAALAIRKGTVEGRDGLILQNARTEEPPTSVVDEDRQLVDRATAGDIGAFEALVRRYQGWVFTLALRMVGDRADAEDMAQEVFLKAYRGLAGFRGGARFSTWLYAVASHHCLNHLASRTARLRRLRRVDGPPPEPGTTGSSPLDRIADEAPGPDAAAEQGELRRVIQDELLQLTEDHRIVIVLRDLQGLPYEDIANALGIELGTVRSRLHRARMELKARLAPRLADGSVR